MASAIQKEFERRIFGESIPRIEKSIGLISKEQIWYKHNEHTNSVGTLILHLAGNVRQWICSGIGNHPDTRKRFLEFTNDQLLSKPELLKELDDLKEDTLTELSKLNDSDMLVMRRVQGYEESTLSVIVHVIEHFSYHTGQIALLVKLFTQKNLGFYHGIDLNQTG